MAQKRTHYYYYYHYYCSCSHIVVHCSTHRGLHITDCEEEKKSTAEKIEAVTIAWLGTQHAHVSSGPPRLSIGAAALSLRQVAVAWVCAYAYLILRQAALAPSGLLQSEAIVAGALAEI